MSDLYDYVIEITTADLRRHGIEPGKRHAGDDPQLTYQSDLAEERVDHILCDQHELTEVLTDNLPPDVAKFLAYVSIHWPSLSQQAEFRSLARKADKDIQKLVEEYVVLGMRWLA